LRITASGFQTHRRHLWRIAGMNDVVSQAGMFGIFLEEGAEHRERFLLRTERCVAGWVSRPPRVTRRRTHRLPGRRDTSGRVCPSPPRRRRTASSDHWQRDHGRRGRERKYSRARDRFSRRSSAHGHAPVGHGAGGIFLCDVLELGPSLFVSEGMQQRHPTREWLLGSGRA
jgi:hypothetical protein